MSMLLAVSKANPLIQPVIDWLVANHADPSKLAADTRERLRSRGRSLPKEPLVNYVKKVLLAEFFTRWAIKHRGRAASALLTDPETKELELRPFDFAMIVAADEKAFKSIAPKFVRQKMVERLGLMAGSGDGFTSFVAGNTLAIAHRFLKNFDTSHPAAALKYIQTTAVSLYLTRRESIPTRSFGPNLEKYLTQSRLSARTILAFKLAYMPALLSEAERRVLKVRYGFSKGRMQRMTIGAVAERLRFKNPAALSRKLYKVRQWCERNQDGPKVLPE